MILLNCNPAIPQNPAVEIAVYFNSQVSSGCDFRKKHLELTERYGKSNKEIVMTELVNRKDEPKLEVGDCVILNEAEQPCARRIMVVSHFIDGRPWCKYLCCATEFSSYNLSGCCNTQCSSTLIADFGVKLVHDGEFYWCENIFATPKAIATYRDGEPRKWQELLPSSKHGFREELMDLIANRPAKKSQFAGACEAATSRKNALEDMLHRLYRKKIGLNVDHRYKIININAIKDFVLLEDDAGNSWKGTLESFTLCFE
jgi:hypothetical protein